MRPESSTETAISTSAMSVRSVSSTGSSSRPSSKIVTAYRQAAQLFLTRRLPEALSTIRPVIVPPARLDGAATIVPGRSGSVAPVAKASRGTRVKIWSFYLTFLNAVVELGPEDGKEAFGTSKWLALMLKTRDGSVWEDVVRDGYGGDEAAVDPEVVINLSTLLLTHSPSQQLNQDRLENYLASTSDMGFGHDQSRRSHANGSFTPQDINTKLRLIELYTLHVLPRNDRWEEARDFITGCELLYDDRQDAFISSLDALKIEVDETRRREQELMVKQGEQMEEARRIEQDRFDRHQRDVAARRRQQAEQLHHQQHQARASGLFPSSRLHSSRTTGSVPAGPSPMSGAPTGSRSSDQTRRSGRADQRPTPSTVQSLSLLSQRLVQAVTNSISALGPAGIARFSVLILLCAITFGNRKVRDRARRILATAWTKVKQTVGMGVRVSYV